MPHRPVALAMRAENMLKPPDAIAQNAVAFLEPHPQRDIRNPVSDNVFFVQYAPNIATSAPNQKIIPFPSPKQSRDGDRTWIVASTKSYPAAVSAQPQLSSFAAPLLPPLHISQSAKPSIYMYSFWRANSASLSQGLLSQYGGSQSAIIARFPVKHTPLTLLMRAAMTPSQPMIQEYALGASWRPDPQFPLDVILERQFRPNAADRMAAYTTIGLDKKKLPHGFTLSGYAQAGLLFDQDGGYFYDGNLHVDHPLIKRPHFETGIGLGVWTGGDHIAGRVDIGPSLHSDVMLNNVQFRISADWRFKIAGNSIPDSGPAITLSAGF